MRTTLIIKRFAQVALLGAVLASPAIAQMGPGMGGGWGGSPGMQGGAGGQVGWYGMGQGGGRGMHGMRRGGMGRGVGGGMMVNQNAARGWQLMTPEERTEQQVKMRAVKTYDECKAVQSEHRSMMEARAKDKGLTLFTPRGNACDNLKARGLIL